jgi:hypothetical protein
MSRLLVTIDQTPCRASYGLLGQEAFRRDLVARQRGVVEESIARYVGRGDRMATIMPGNGVADIAAEAYLDEPVVEVTITSVARPIIGVAEVTGIDIVI